MTESQQVLARRPRSRGWLWLLVGVLAAVGLGAAGVWWFLGRSPAPPAPPEAKGDRLDPGVVSAVQVVRQRVLKDPRSAQAWGDLGEVFLANELEDESLPCFAEAERLDASNPRWPYYQAGPLLNRGELETAVPILSRAAERCPFTPGEKGEGGDEAAAIRLRLAETLLTLGRQDEAETQIQSVLDRRPDDPRALFDLALLAVSREQWEAARADLLRCLGNPFTQQKARVQLAAVCGRLNDVADADAYRVQADHLPKDADWLDPFVAEYLSHWSVNKRDRYRVVEQYEAAGRFANALGVLRPMAAESPDDSLVHLTLGQCLAQMGDYGAAEIAFRRALALAPGKVQAQYYLGLNLFKEGEQLAGRGDADRARAERLFQEAASLARQALTTKPDYGYAYMVLGLSQKGRGRRSEALSALRQAVQCNPEVAEFHLYFGELLSDDGQAAEARSQLEEALRLAPPGAPWRQEARDRLK